LEMLEQGNVINKICSTYSTNQKGVGWFFEMRGK